MAKHIFSKVDNAAADVI